jgi:hypothetical protein
VIKIRTSRFNFGVFLFLGAWLLVVSAAGCTQQQQEAATTTSTTTAATTSTATPGYKVYNGTDASGQGFSLEYPESWIVSEETLTSSWENGQWISVEGPGSWETGAPILNLWIVPRGGSFANAASYNAAAYSDRNVAAAEGDSPGMLSETATTETVAGITAEGWTITFRTIFPIGYTYTQGTIEVDMHVAGTPTTAERKWAVFQKENYLYDLNFVAIGDKVASCESAYRHAKNTFRFN